MGEPSDNKVVLFVDVLGFAELTKSYSVDIDLLKAVDRPLSAFNLDTIDKVSNNRLTHVFSGFHRSLRGALWFTQMSHPLTAITFSDSAFIATTYVYQAVKIAIDLIQSLMPQGIPVRIGIGYGSFAALRFRSDITSDGGDHAAQFLGTAIVHAHAAETCGIKGLRILLHPSVMPLLDDINHNPLPPTDLPTPFEPLFATLWDDNAQNPVTSEEIKKKLINFVDNSAARAKLIEKRFHYVECSEKEWTNRADVHHEIDYWQFIPTREAAAWRGLQDMWDKAPVSAVEHYELTAEAINRMRIAHGHEPLKKLRRRTLPR